MREILIRVLLNPVVFSLICYSFTMGVIKVVKIIQSVYKKQKM
jgi:hypothetical protein